MGCEARKIPADAGVFFLDFSLYRTSQELTVRTKCLSNNLAVPLTNSKVADMETLPDFRRSASNRVYKFNRGYKWLILVAGSLGFLLIFGLLVGAQSRHENLSPGLMSLAVLELAGFLAAIVYVERRSSRTLQISDEGIFVRDGRGDEIGGIRWIELGRVSERRVMGRLVLWDQGKTQRVVIDQQFEPSAEIRSRILDEYTKVFTPRPLPVEFRSSHLLNTQSVLVGLATAFFLSMTWMANQQNAKGPALVFVAFTILSLISFLSLYPQLRGPSTLFEDRLVLRTLFRTRELFKKDITGVEMKDVANSTGTKFSMVILKTTKGQQAKITFVYGDIPDIYLTLKAWLAR